MLSETKIRCFLCLADTLSFTEAAGRLFMTQQAVSKHISQLEQDMGFPLFERTRRSVKLTKSGERCYEIFSEFITKYDAFLYEHREAYRQHTTIRAGYLSWFDYGSSPIMALYAVRRVMPSFELIGERYSPGMLNKHLADGRLDVILTHRRFLSDEAGLRVLELDRIPLVLMVSMDNPLATDDATVATFSREPLLIDAFECETISETLHRAKTEAAWYGLEPESVVVVPNRDTIYTAAELGQGIIISTDQSRAGRSKVLKKYPTGVMESLVCVWKEDAGSDAIELYARCLQREYRQQFC